MGKIIQTYTCMRVCVLCDKRWRVSSLTLLISLSLSLFFQQVQTVKNHVGKISSCGLFATALTRVFFPSPAAAVALECAPQDASPAALFSLMAREPRQGFLVRVEWESSYWHRWAKRWRRSDSHAYLLYFPPVEVEASPASAAAADADADVLSRARAELAAQLAGSGGAWPQLDTGTLQRERGGGAAVDVAARARLFHHLAPARTGAILQSAMQIYDASIKPCTAPQLALHVAWMSQYDDRTPFTTRGLCRHTQFCEWDVPLCSARPSRTTFEGFDPFMPAGPTLFGALPVWRVFRVDDGVFRANLARLVTDCFSAPALAAGVPYGVPPRTVRWNSILNLQYQMNTSTEAEGGVHHLRLNREDVEKLGD